jgi:hypothetical protein
MLRSASEEDRTCFRWDLGNVALDGDDDGDDGGDGQSNIHCLMQCAIWNVRAEDIVQGFKGMIRSCVMVGLELACL